MRQTIALLAALAAAPLLAQSKTYEVKNSTAEFHAEDTYDSFDGKTGKVSGTIVADPAKPAESSVAVTIDMSSLDTGNSLRNKEMKELYLHTAKFPAASFKSVSVAGAPPDINVTGDFTLHGVTKRMTFPVHVTLLADGRIHALSNFKVHMPDFGISVPHNILVTVEDMVPVRLDVWASPK
ncbi:MAG TPA: YceI family protein [Thermoanaerobaculia bacterium]|nr:YceI family protein [Thermoanaerobaculia bacterium]